MKSKNLKNTNAAFENGSTRSEKRLRYDLVPKCAIDGIAHRLTIGVVKHGANNWKGGGPEFFTETYNHLIVHLTNYNEGILDGEEQLKNHLEAVLTNAAMLLWWHEKNNKKK